MICLGICTNISPNIPANISNIKWQDGPNIAIVSQFEAHKLPVRPAPRTAPHPAAATKGWCGAKQYASDCAGPGEFTTRKLVVCCTQRKRTGNCWWKSHKLSQEAYHKWWFRMVVGGIIMRNVRFHLGHHLNSPWPIPNQGCLDDVLWWDTDHRGSRRDIPACLSMRRVGPRVLSNLVATAKRCEARHIYPLVMKHG